MDNNTKCAQRIKSVSDKLKREGKIIDILDTEGLIKRLQTVTGIENIGWITDPQHLRSLNIVLLNQTIDHDMSIAMCKCSKDLEISIPDNIESPKQFHNYVLEQTKQKRK